MTDIEAEMQLNYWFGHHKLHGWVAIDLSQHVNHRDPDSDLVLIRLKDGIAYKELRSNFPNKLYRSEAKMRTMAEQLGHGARFHARLTAFKSDFIEHKLSVAQEQVRMLLSSLEP